jgi:hypothetical protein
MSTDEIDALLERYLYLLDQYTALRAELSSLQSSVTPESLYSSRPVLTDAQNRSTKTSHAQTSLLTEASAMARTTTTSVCALHDSSG